MFPVGWRHHRSLLQLSSAPHRRQEPHLQPAEPVRPVGTGRLLHDWAQALVTGETGPNQTGAVRKAAAFK